MPKDYQVGDQTYSFPDDYSDDQVQGILTKQGIIPPVNVMHLMARRREGLQPQKGEPQAQPDIMSSLAGAATMGAAGSTGAGILGSVLPSGIAPALGVGLKAAGTGAVAGGLDALWGGKHPIQTGLDTAITTGVLDLPAESSAVRALLPTPLKKLYDLFESQNAVASNSAGLLKKQLMKYGGLAESVQPSPVSGVRPKIKPSERSLSIQDWLEQEKQKLIKGVK